MVDDDHPIGTRALHATQPDPLGEIRHRDQLAAYVSDPKQPRLGARHGRYSRPGDDFANIVAGDNKIIWTEAKCHADPQFLPPRGKFTAVTQSLRLERKQQIEGSITQIPERLGHHYQAVASRIFATSSSPSKGLVI